MDNHIQQMRRLQEYSISEAQFAQFLGKSRMYQYLPNKERKQLPEMLMTDTQINLVTRAYYSDSNFGRKPDEKELSMWKMRCTTSSQEQTNLHTLTASLTGHSMLENSHQGYARLCLETVNTPGSSDDMFILMTHPLLSSSSTA